ncbi:ferredoxin--NADP reductase, partial [Acinetobacter baumannii]
MSIEKFSVEKVLSVHRWTPTLFSFTMTRPSPVSYT